MAWRSIGFKGAVQGNLDPVVLFADWKHIQACVEAVLRRAQGYHGHIFNLGHGILPETPVENVKAVAAFVHEHSASLAGHGRDLGAAR
jgi:uroporphyrinogen decarboxylase